MKCQRCVKQATLHITDVIDLNENRYEEAHLCEDCAKKYLYEPEHKKHAKPGHPAADADEDAPAGARCPACGITFLEFRNHGRFGCPHDYDAFSADLLPLLEGVHSDTRHAGKTPRRAPRVKTARAELAQLRQRLQALVSEEKYEEAARTRDRIRELEGN